MKLQLPTSTIVVVVLLQAFTSSDAAAVSATNEELSSATSSSSSSSAVPAQKFLRGLKEQSDEAAAEEEEATTSGLQQDHQQRNLDLGSFGIRSVGFKCSISPDIPGDKRVNMELKLDAMNDGLPPYEFEYPFNEGEYDEHSTSGELFWFGNDADTLYIEATVRTRYLYGEDGSALFQEDIRRSYEWPLMNGLKYHLCLRDNTFYDQIVGACWVEFSTVEDSDGLSRMGTPSRASEDCCVPGMPGNGCP